MGKMGKGREQEASLRRKKVLFAIPDHLLLRYHHAPGLKRRKEGKKKEKDGALRKKGKMEREATPAYFRTLNYFIIINPAEGKREKQGKEEERGRRGVIKKEKKGREERRRSHPSSSMQGR